MANRTTYDVHVHREGKFWAIDVPGVGFTQATRLTEVEETARDMVALTTEVEEDSFDLAVDIVIPSNAKEHVKQARALREEAARIQAKAALESALSAAVLKEDGLTYREIGLVLEVSHQRAQQLASGANREHSGAALV
ncbi:hypothetical protein [Curtobacterium sp. MCLR17_042]|jgi:hypothetical protein|uniref:hypothetical protein n=1 Tax=Curtobacterium sp. MCLR17_042 TaxID=2175626 RepID=UPI000DA88C71|nr:hypothetical protein [Curtobacterium sp. MCLR17_042]PZE24650.1 hypothetical protein DEJ02_14775 [Curtobacterium sp. MCLR17_042]